MLVAVIYVLTGLSLFFVIHISLKAAGAPGLFLPSEQLCLQIMSVQAQLHLYQLAVLLASCSVTVNNLNCVGVCILQNNMLANGHNVRSGCRMQSCAGHGLNTLTQTFHSNTGFSWPRKNWKLIRNFQKRDKNVSNMELRGRHTLFSVFVCLFSDLAAECPER